MKIAVWFLGIALAASLYMNHLLSARVAVLQAYLNILVPR
jgi:hypothetical protein